MRELYKELKELTGFSYGDVGEYLGISRQRVSEMAKNYSTTHRLANQQILYQMSDCKIDELQEQIEEIKMFMDKVINYKKVEED